MCVGGSKENLEYFAGCLYSDNPFRSSEWTGSFISKNASYEIADCVQRIYRYSGSPYAPRLSHYLPMGERIEAFNEGVECENFIQD